ncbi:MAG: two-component sensor histidine kinase [Thermoleophilia bacterium]|nr:two-component sensor histidine kinase [Thermoleophilia bacterium]
MRRDFSQLIDAGVVLVVGAIAIAGAAARAQSSDRPYAVSLAVAAVASLLFRRRAPALTLAISGGLVLALFALDRTAATLAVVAPAAALYSLALVRGRAHIVIGTFAAAAAVVVADVFLAGGHPHTLTLQTISHAALVAVPVLAGEALRNHRSNVRLLLERAELAERTREEEAQRRAEQERLRIARELHDVVAHTLTTINVQAGVAKHLLDREPGHAEGALATIESASHDALQELRAILGVLREPADGAAPLAPAPDLDAIPTLIEQARTDGSSLDLEIEGEPPEQLPEALQLAAYRIVQESLTNWRRHAAGTPATVAFSYSGDRLAITIENPTVNGHSGATVAGAGIVGMRERAAAVGGTLEVGEADGHFRVDAELPYRPSAA